MVHWFNTLLICFVAVVLFSIIVIVLIIITVLSSSSTLRLLPLSSSSSSSLSSLSSSSLYSFSFSTSSTSSSSSLCPPPPGTSSCTPPIMICDHDRPLRTALTYPLVLNALNLVPHHHSSPHWSMMTCQHTSWNPNHTRIKRHPWMDGRPGWAGCDTGSMWPTNNL